MSATFSVALSSAARGRMILQQKQVAAARRVPALPLRSQRHQQHTSSQSRGLHRWQGRKRSIVSAPSVGGASSTSSSSASEKLKDAAAGGLPSLSSAAQKLGLPALSAVNKDHLLFVIGNSSYMVLISGFMMTDMLSLRMALGAGYAGLVTYHSLRTNPLRIPQYWSGVFALINVGAACLLFKDELFPEDDSLSREDEDLYHKHFPMLKKANYRRLMELGTRQVLEDGAVLTEEGVPSNKLYFLESGLANMAYRKGLGKTILEKGTFVNDVAFQQGAGAGAFGTVVTSGRTNVIVWDHDQLRALLKSRPEMDRNVKVCLTEHLMYALMRQRDEAQMSTENMSADDRYAMEEETRHFVRRWRYDAAPEADAEALWVI